jgi:uroporphyrinogen III methyltransferase/synthase
MNWWKSERLLATENSTLNALPSVFLVGAGPGNPGLLTVRAWRCLERADLVIYDRLVPDLILALSCPRAVHLCVSDLADKHAARGRPVIEAMIEAVRAGRTVVRLKGGDPLIFGRGGEEAEALYAAGIPFEIVPGITAAVGAAAYAGVPLTDRRSASAVALVAGHEDMVKGSSAIDWPALARFPGTLAIYMGIARLSEITGLLIRAGKPIRTPALAVQEATSGGQRTVEAALEDLAETARAAGISAPAVVMIGDVVASRPHLSWFDSLPLRHCRVMITRPLAQTGSLAQELCELGALPLHLPLIEITEPHDWSSVDRAIAEISAFDWLVFTSANGVHAFVKRLRMLGGDLRALGRLRLAVIGSATAETLRGYHLEPDLVPGVFRSEALAADLGEHVRGKRVLLARANRGRELLREELSRCADVTEIAVYTQIEAVNHFHSSWARLRTGDVDFVTLTSSNIARVFAKHLDLYARKQIDSGKIQIVTISPVTSETVREMGLPVAGEASVYNQKGLIDAVIEGWEKRARGNRC